jgi:hypothetical protein
LLCWWLVLACFQPVFAQTPATVPAVAATRIDGHGFTLGWGPLPQDIDEARVEILGPKGGKSFGLLATVPKTARGYFLQRVSYAGKYKFRLSVVRGGTVQSGPVTSYSTLKAKGPNGWADNLVEVTAFATHVDLKWTEAATNEAGIKVYRRDEADLTQPVEILLPKDSISYRDTIPVPGLRYLYSVATVDKKGLGWPGMELLVEVPLPGDLPGGSRPSPLVSQEGGGVVLRWTPVLGGNAEGYSVQRQIHRSWDGYIEVGRTARFETSFVDTRPGASAGSNYRLVAFNSNGVADPYRGTMNTPPLPRGHQNWQEPVVAGDVIHVLAADGRKIHRFNAASGGWSAPLVPKIPGPVFRFAVGDPDVFVASNQELYRVSPLTGEAFLLGSEFGHGSLIARGNFLVYGQSVVLEPAADVGTWQAARSETGNIYLTRPIGTAPGRYLVQGSDGPDGVNAVQSLAIEGLGVGSLAISRLPQTTAGIFPVAGGKMLLSTDGWLTVEGDSKSPPIATVCGTGVRDAVSLPDGFTAVLRASEILVFDRWWNRIQKLDAGDDAFALRWVAGRLWSIASDSSAPEGYRIDGHDVTLTPGDFWTSPFPPELLAGTADGGQVLVHRASGTWWRREPGAPAFGPPQEGSEAIIDWKFDRTGDALVLLWGGGKVTRHAFSGDPAGTWQRNVSRAVSFVIEIAGKLEFSTGQPLTWDGQPATTPGYWLHRPNFTAVDPARKFYYVQWGDDLSAGSLSSTYTPTPSLWDLNDESFRDFLRFSPEGNLVVFGGGLICTYPDFTTTRQLPLAANAAEWTADGLAALGVDAAGRSMIGSFDREGKKRAAAVLPGTGRQLARDGADGWMYLCTFASGGWQLVQTNAALSNFTKLAGVDASAPFADASLPDAAMRNPEWYEERMHIGDPENDGFTAVQEYMLGKLNEWKSTPAVAFYNAPTTGMKTFQIRRFPDASLAPFRVAIEHSTDLATWTETIPAGFKVAKWFSGAIEVVHITSESTAPGASYFRVRFVGPTFAD